MGDTDFPAVMGNTPVGFLQQYVKGSKMYSQKGDNVPEFTNNFCLLVVRIALYPLKKHLL